MFGGVYLTCFLERSETASRQRIVAKVPKSLADTGHLLTSFYLIMVDLGNMTFTDVEGSVYGQQIDQNS